MSTHLAKFTLFIPLKTQFFIFTEGKPSDIDIWYFGCESKYVNSTFLKGVIKHTFYFNRGGDAGKNASTHTGH